MFRSPFHMMSSKSMCLRLAAALLLVSWVIGEHVELCPPSSVLTLNRKLYAATFNARKAHLHEDRSFQLFAHGLGIPPSMHAVLGVGIEWGPENFFNKPKAFLDFVQQSIKKEVEAKRDVSMAFALLMDYDTFINAPDIDTFWRYYDCARHSKSILLSAESRCWMGVNCKKDLISTYFNNIENTMFPFPNGGIMVGSLRNLETMLLHIILNKNYYMGLQDPSIKTFSDQSAVVIWAQKHPDLVAVDTDQIMFGTTALYLEEKDENFPKKGWGVCRGSNGVFVEHCRDHSRDLKELGVFFLDQRTCSLHRNLTSYVENIKSKVAVVTPNVVSAPAIWHGSGEGRSTFSFYRHLVEKCLLKKYTIT